MKIYISKKSEIYLKWFYLILGVPNFCLGVVLCTHDYLYTNMHGAFFAIIMCAGMAIYMAYYAFQPSVLLIDDDKIILKGLWREIKYDINDFKDIVPYWNSFKIIFNDNKSYWFVPEISWGYTGLILSRGEKLSKITQQINLIKAQHKDKHRV